MAASTFIKHLYDGTISLADGTGTPVTLTVPFTVGDLSVSGLSETQKNVVAYETRGTFNTLRHTSRTYPSGSFSAHLADYSDATESTLIDFILAANSYSGNASTSGANAEVYTIDITLTVEGTDYGDAADHTIVLTDCQCTLDTAEGEPNTATINFTCYGTVTFT